MNTLTFYIIFHKSLIESNTKSFTESSIKFLKWVAVNKKIPKNYPAWIPAELLIKEWEMPIHSPLYQMTHFYQNSFFLHLYWNKELITSKYIGFGQYDMSVNSKDLEDFVKGHEHDNGEAVCGAFPHPISYLATTYSEEFWKSTFVDTYNSYYGTAHTLESLAKLPMFLYHTFIIPSWFFLHMMPYVEKLLPKLLENMEWDTRHMAGTLERIFALCISCGILEGKLRKVFLINGIVHEDGQRDSDPFRGIP